MTELKKTCIKCGAQKPLTMFHKKQFVNGKQYYRAECAECTNIAVRAARSDDFTRSKRAEAARRDRKNNPEKYSALSAARLKKETEQQREKRLAYQKEYKSKNKDRIAKYRTKEKIRAWYEAFYAKHSESIKEKNLEYKKKNLDRCREWRHNRERKEKSGRLSRGIIKKLYELQRGKCACCGRSLQNSFHLDHIVPLSKGGENVDSNVQLLLAECNMKKSAKDPIEYMQSKGFLL